MLAGSKGIDAPSDNLKTELFSPDKLSVSLYIYNSADAVSCILNKFVEDVPEGSVPYHCAYDSV